MEMNLSYDKATLVSDYDPIFFITVPLLFVFAQLTAGQYGETYTGDGTYYGHVTDGNCAYGSSPPKMYNDMYAGDK